jgi:hypothetical protein
VNKAEERLMTKPDGTQLVGPERDLLSSLQEWLRDDENSVPEQGWRTCATEDYNMYAGKQDSAEVLRKLAFLKRPSTVFNEIKPKIDRVIGLGDQVRQVPEALPVGFEDEPLAELTNGALKHFRRTQGLSDKEMECYEHIIKGGRSFMYFHINKENPFKPQVAVKRFHGRDVVVDPDSVEYDLSDARRIHLFKWFHEDDIKIYWPQFKEAISLFSRESAGMALPSYFDVATKKYRIVETWYKKLEPAYWFINPITGRQEYLKKRMFQRFSKQLSDGLTLADGQVFQQSELEYAETRMPFYYVSLHSGGILLGNTSSPHRYRGFPVTQYGAYKDDDENRWFSLITVMKDPQKSLNTMRRQLSHLLQTSPKGLLVHEQGAIVNEEDYALKSSEPNFRLEIAKGKMEKWRFSDQPTISNIYAELDAVYQQSMKDTSGVTDGLMGVQTFSREPAEAAHMRQMASLSVLYLPLTNFRKSRVHGTKIFHSLIQQYMSYEQMIRVEGMNGAQLVQINSQINPQVEGFNDMSVGEYDIAIDEQAENVTMRKGIAEMLMEFARNSPGTIPPDLIFEYTDAPYSVKQQIREYNEARLQEEREFKEMELQIELLKAQKGGEKKETKVAKPKKD